MNWKRKVRGGVVVFIGFMLSPLSWWNDAFVNLPLALAFAWLISLMYRPAFRPAVVVGYWMTNVLGFVLMHRGGWQMFSKNAPRPYSRRDLIRDLLISLLYTGLIVALLKLSVHKPFTDYM